MRCSRDQRLKSLSLAEAWEVRKDFNPLEITETLMKLVTAFELATKTDIELSALQRAFQDALVQSKPSSAARRNALASLESITRERALRLTL